ncbi:MAG: YtxH domain-containing protein [Dehalococcoidia bacterium]|nr:YtxH domain-containing protein [Dehalococcoidia bacterium]
MDEHGHELRSFMIGALVGAAVGAALGILLAPRSGAETRKMIGAKATELSGKLQDEVEDLKQKAAEIRERVQQIARPKDSPKQT